MDTKELANVVLFWVVAFLIVFSVIYICSRAHPQPASEKGLGISWVIFWLMLVLGVISFSLLVYSAYLSFADKKVVNKLTKYLVFQVSLVSLLLLWILFMTAYLLRV